MQMDKRLYWSMDKFRRAFADPNADGHIPAIIDGIHKIFSNLQIRSSNMNSPVTMHRLLSAEFLVLIVLRPQTNSSH